MQVVQCVAVVGEDAMWWCVSLFRHFKMLWTKDTEGLVQVTGKRVNGGIMVVLSYHGGE